MGQIHTQYGKLIKGRKTLEDLKQAFAWQVDKESLFLEGGIHVPGFYGVVRQDNRKTLGVVKERYGCLQNDQVLGVVDDLLGIGGGEVYDHWSHAGGARNSTRILFPEYLAPNVQDDKDFLQLCLTVYWSHDGSGSVWYIVNAIRAYCLNGLLRLGKQHSLDTVRHSKNAEFKLENVRQILADASEEFTELGETFRKISEVPYGGRLGEYVKTVLDVKETDDSKISTRTQNVINTIKSLAKNGRGNHGETFWDAYNGVTEFVDHYRSGENREWNAVAGSGAEIKSRALAVAEQFAELITVR